MNQIAFNVLQSANGRTQFTNKPGQLRCPRWVSLAGFVCCLLFILFDFVVLTGS
jgi:hypothetical protein